jgi:hypothetical protein
MKNWLNDLRFGCINDLRFGCINEPKSIEKHMDLDSDMVSKNENLIVNFNLFEED